MGIFLFIFLLKLWSHPNFYCKLSSQALCIELPTASRATALRQLCPSVCTQKGDETRGNDPAWSYRLPWAQGAGSTVGLDDLSGLSQPQ